MSNLFTSRDPAGVVVGQTAAIFGVLAAGAVNAHMSGVAAMRQAREASSSHQLRAQLDAAIDYAEQIMSLAAEQAAEIERLRAENGRLKAVAKQNYEAVRRLTRKAA